MLCYADIIQVCCKSSICMNIYDEVCQSKKTITFYFYFCGLLGICLKQDICYESCILERISKFTSIVLI